MNDLQYYEVKRRLFDNDNNLILPRGAYVQTMETGWVGRFGRDLKKVETIPSGVRPTVIKNTVEGVIQKPIPAMQETAKRESGLYVETPAVQRAIKGRASKVVLNEEVADK